jgi:hypothetical protein
MTLLGLKIVEWATVSDFTERMNIDPLVPGARPIRRIVLFNTGNSIEPSPQTSGPVQMGWPRCSFPLVLVLYLSSSRTSCQSASVLTLDSLKPGSSES